MYVSVTLVRSKTSYNFFHLSVFPKFMKIELRLSVSKNSNMKILHCIERLKQQAHYDTIFCWAYLATIFEAYNAGA